MQGRLFAVLLALAATLPRPGATAPARAAPPESAAASLDVLAWNLFLRPRKLFENQQDVRAAEIPHHVADYEVLVLSEAFDDGLRRQIVRALRDSHPHVSAVVGRDRGYKQDGGVFVLSRWPIAEQDSVLYGDVCVGTDCLADKGALYVRILKEGKPYHLFATHLQATDSTVREQQLRILREFAASKEIPSSEPVLYAGDLNVNRYSDEFRTMLGLLDANLPRAVGHPFTIDPDNDFVPDDRAGSFLDYVLYSNGHRRPVRSALETQIFRAAESDLSDHYAVLGRLLFD